MRARLKLLSLALVAGLSLSACSGLFETAAAVVDGERIDDDTVRRQLAFLLEGPLATPGMPQPEEQRREFARQFLTFLIQQRLLDRFAETRRITASSSEIDQRVEQLFVPEGDETTLQALLERSGATAGDVRELVRQQIVRERVFDSVVQEELTDEGLLEEYQRRIQEFTQLDVAHILVSDASRAQTLAERVTPQNFAEMARRFSEDAGSAERGGDLGFVRAADQVEAFAGAAMDAEPGTVTGPVQTEFGYHLIYVKSRQTVPFESVRDQLRQELAAQVFGRWLLGRLREAEVRVNPRYGVFDERSGQVVERRSTADQPDVQLSP